VRGRCGVSAAPPSLSAGLPHYIIIIIHFIYFIYLSLRTTRSLRRTTRRCTLRDWPTPARPHGSRLPAGALRARRTGRCTFAPAAPRAPQPARPRAVHGPRGPGGSERGGLTVDPCRLLQGASGGSQPSSPTGHLAPRVSQGDAWGSGPPGSGGRAARRPEPIVLATVLPAPASAARSPRGVDGRRARQTRPGTHIPRAGVAGRAPSPEPLQPGRKQMVYM